jgi:hypothetical protein
MYVSSDGWVEKGNVGAYLQDYTASYDTGWLTLSTAQRQTEVFLNTKLSHQRLQLFLYSFIKSPIYLI